MTFLGVFNNYKLQAQRKNISATSRKQRAEQANKQTVLPNANAKSFIPRISKNNDNAQNILPTSQSVPRPTYITANCYGRCTGLLLSSKIQ